MIITSLPRQKRRSRLALPILSSPEDGRTRTLSVSSVCAGCRAGGPAGPGSRPPRTALAAYRLQQVPRFRRPMVPRVRLVAGAAVADLVAALRERPPGRDVAHR